MAIQMRRGPLAKYNKNKMLAGEWGISIDADTNDQKAMVAFAPGVDKEVMFVEDAAEQIAVATAEAIDTATEEAEAWAHGNSFHVNDYASGNGSTRSFTLAQTPSTILGVYIDGAVTTAYTRSGKTITFTTAPASGQNNIRVYYTVNTATDNSKYYKEQAASSASSASTSASTATTKASQASASASQASTSAQTATTKASQASASATAAATSETNAEHYASMLNAERLLGNFAKYQSTLTASKAYKVGEFLTYNGYLYRVTTAIASGGTITPGTNCVQTTVGDEVAKVDSRVDSRVDEQIDNKFGDDIGDNVTAWLTEHVTPSGSAVIVDNTLTIAGAAADAKKTGKEITGLKEGLKSTLELIEYTNIVSPQFDEKNVNTASAERTTVSDIVNVTSGKTYFGYALINISNLSGYTTGAMYLDFIHTLNFVLTDRYAGNSQQPIQNGDIELYGSFTPSSNGTVKATIFVNNIGTNYTFTVKVKKLYLFESSADLSSLCASMDYSDVLAYSEIKDGTITADDLDDELRNKIIPVESKIIDCWGDSLTAGAGSTSVTYPSRLQTLIGENFTVNNYGQGSENAEAVAFRQGGLNGIVEPFTASTSFVTVNSLISVDGGSLGTLNLQGTYYGNNVVTINGTNYFYRRVDESHCKFARISGSSDLTYTRPMLVKAEGKGIHHILIICVGQNGWVNNDPNALANIIQKMVNYNAYDKYIVVGIPTGNTSSRSTVEQTLGSAFGNHFVNAREYISAWGCSDNNITPTTEDTEAMAIGAIPPSLRSDSVHLNNNGYTAMGNCIYQRGVSLGYWT